MTQLILIKHASPAVEAGKPPERWALSEAGREAARRLAGRVAELKPAAVYSSDETKAVQTAQAVAEAAGLAVQQRAELREHDRSNVPQLESREFISLMELLFRKPGELVLGQETADAAEERLAAAIAAIAREQAGKTVAIVSHGTVLALYLAKITGRKPYELWRQMGLPSYAIVDADGGKLIELQPKI